MVEFSQLYYLQTGNICTVSLFSPCQEAACQKQSIWKQNTVFLISPQQSLVSIFLTCFL